jgi:PPP family 3-phenylpropionic acid transporter
MFLWRRFGGRLSARHMILISAGVSVLRWIAMAFAPPVPVLVALQLTHGITFAIGYLGCVHFIANWTSEDIAAETQSLFTVAQQVMSVIALIGFGWVIGLLGDQAYLIAALVAFVGAVCIWGSLQLQPTKDG